MIQQRERESFAYIYMHSWVYTKMRGTRGFYFAEAGYFWGEHL